MNIIKEPSAIFLSIVVPKGIASSDASKNHDYPEPNNRLNFGQSAIAGLSPKA
jgi:hypothetical protein